MMKVQKNNQGLSIIELLLATTLISIIGLSFVTLQYYISRNQTYVWNNYLGVEDANQNIMIMTREIRNMRQAENGAYPLERAWDQELSFYTDTDLDGQSEKVRYYLDGTNLMKSVIDPVGNPATYPPEQEKLRAVSASVSNGTDPIFYYYNGDWPEDTTNNPLDTPTRLSETKLMRIDISIDPTDNEEEEFAIDTYIQIRNLKDNL